MKKTPKSKPSAKKPVIKKTPSSLNDLAITELSGDHSKAESIDASETDDDENEGLGDGKIGRSDKDVLNK
jgi:hypothetical protein